MKCLTLGLLILIFSFVVQADPAVSTMSDQTAGQAVIQNAAPDVTTSVNQGVDNSQDDRQIFLPSGSGAIPVKVTDDKEAEKSAGTAIHSDTDASKAVNNVEHGAEPVKNKSAEAIKEQWGVGEFIVRQTSAGYMLDIRYRVFDKEKARPLFSRQLRPFIIEESSGVKYGVPASPKVGFLRQAPQHVKENKQYFLMIANPGQRIKTGDKLTLVIGDFRVEHLTVE
jgi:hypothetical protein